jgi:hypothetical protein
MKWMYGLTFKINVLIMGCVLVSSCTSSRFVKPLAKNQQAIQAGLGGPTIKFAGAVVPVPFTSVCYARGLTDKLTAFGSIHTTSLLFGNAQTDVGITTDVIRIHPQFIISVSPTLQMVYNIRNKTGFRVWPSIDVNLRYEQKNNKGYFYLGAMTWIETAQKRAFQQTQKKHSIPNLQLGYCITKTKWQHSFELKYLGIGVANTPGVVDYIGLNKKGSFGIYYSVSYLF